MKQPFLFRATFAALALVAAHTSLAIDAYDQSRVPLEVDAPESGLTKIVLLASGPSSKAMAHEYFAGCALLMDWLKQQRGVWPVMARDWPANERVLEGAKCVVYYGDGGGKQPFLEPKRWAVLSRLMESGVGFVLLHQAMDLPAGPESEKLQAWLGGVFRGDIGCRGHWDMEFTEIAAHPVTRGVKPFAAPADGWLYNMHFAERGVTPLLVGAVPEKSRTTADAKKHNGRAEVIAWAYERPGGGRGFSFTGADLHKSWSYESQRKLVLNGILWSAHLPVPAAGAVASFDPAALERNLDDKRAPVAAKSPAALKKQQ
jgi:type 1 glutamine amidotransferase